MSIPFRVYGKKIFLFAEASLDITDLFPNILTRSFPLVPHFGNAWRYDDTYY